MRDIFVDIETTGTDPYHSGIFQIGAVKFDLFTGRIGETFKVSIVVPPNRTWSDGTRQFWAERVDLFNDCTKNPKQPIEGLREFIDWVNKDMIDPHFWAKPTHFDYNFIQSYCDQYNLVNPFRFWKARDLRSFMLGIYAPEPLPHMAMKAGLTEHDALADALNETMWAIEAYQNKKK